MPEINGNVDGVRRSLLQEMELLYDLEIEPGVFLPHDLASLLGVYTSRLKREISVYISRDGCIVDITLGSASTVPLSTYHTRRNRRRLSGVRCVHTHPNGVPELSDVDLSALRSMRLDAMCAVGVDANGTVTGVSAAFLGEPNGNDCEIHQEGPVALDKLPQDAWTEEILRADELVRKTLDSNPDQELERALLVGMESADSMDELARLAESAGAQVVGRALQKRDKPDGATYIGSGKAAELALSCQSLEADIAIFDEELSGIQVRNLEQILNVRVVDRTTLILDIFAQRAQSREGKLQVELAQLNYQSTRLIGQGLVLSRLAGGIGTRGPGESKLEINRRRIRERVNAVRRELENVDHQRSLRRKMREKNRVPLVALVGYTNAGKSTLLNRISGAGVYVQDQLFATLDAVSRQVKPKQGAEFLLTDTVGFVRKLPHALVDAFRSTLEEVTLADLLIVVNDASSPDCLKQRAVVRDVLASLHAGDTPCIDVLNKCDLATELPFLPGAINISAQNGTGVDGLMNAIDAQLSKLHRTFSLLVPYERQAMAAALHQMGAVKSQRFVDDGTVLDVALSDEQIAALARKYGADAVIPCEGASEAGE